MNNFFFFQISKHTKYFPNIQVYMNFRFKYFTDNKLIVTFLYMKVTFSLREKGAQRMNFHCITADITFALTES